MTYSKALILVALFACISSTLASYYRRPYYYYYKPELETSSGGYTYGDAVYGGKIVGNQYDYSYVNDKNPAAGSYSRQDLHLQGGYYGHGGMKHGTKASLDYAYPDLEISSGEYGYADIKGYGNLHGTAWSNGYSRANEYGSAAGHNMKTVASGYGSVNVKAGGGSSASSEKGY